MDTQLKQLETDLKSLKKSMGDGDKFQDVMNISLKIQYIYKSGQRSAKMSSGICWWLRSWSDCTSVQSDQDLHRLLTKSLHTTYIYNIIRFFINVQEHGQHPHQWAPFQIAGLLYAWQVSHQISRYVYHKGWYPRASTLCNSSLSAASMSSWASQTHAFHQPVCQRLSWPYEWKANARMILCACAGWSESSHYAHGWRHFNTWHSPEYHYITTGIGVSLYHNWDRSIIISQLG